MNRTVPLFAAALLLIVAAPVWGQSPPVVSPEDAGLSTEALDELSKYLQKHIDEKHMAGATALIARHGKIGYFKSFGVRDVDTEDTMQNDSIYRIYSMSKPITSVAVMILYEEGRFELDDPVSKYIPELGGLEVVVKETDPKEGAPAFSLEASDRDITVRDLLRHTSGLTYGWYGIPELDKQHEMMNIRDWTLAEFTTVLAAMPLSFQPGATWEYGSSTELLGRFVEVISDTTFDAFLEERIFKPLGMKNTGFHIPEENNKDRLATLYGHNKDKTVGPPPAGWDESYVVPPIFFSGAGGLVSTTEDYFKFCQMMLNEGELNGVRILSPQTVKLMTRNHLGEGTYPLGLRGFGFGLGFLIRPDGTYDWGGAASTTFWIDPAKEVVGVFMTQIAPEVRKYGGKFRTLTYRAVKD